MSKRLKTRRRAAGKTQDYVSMVGNTCANPECGRDYGIEGHHITPLKDGGDDKFWNMVALCRKCHRGGKFHSDPDSHKIELMTWKTSQEMSVLKFFLDEQDPQFDSLLQRARYMAAIRGRGGITVREIKV